MNIYDKLTTIMNNTPKVYEAGYKVSQNKPYINTSKITNFQYFCSYEKFSYDDLCKLDTSNGTNFNSMFNNCKKMTSIPLIDTSKGTNFSSMFSMCVKLTSIPKLNTSNGTDFSRMFYMCQDKLTNIPLIDTSKGTNFSSMFSCCSALTSIPELDTSNGTNFSYMFDTCNVVTIPKINFSKCTSSSGWSGIFSQCRKLKNITFEGTLNPYTKKLSLAAATNLTVESMLSLFNALVDLTGQTTKTITLGSTNLAKLTNEQKQIYLDKNWTVN